MTNFRKIVFTSVAFMMMSTAVHALTPVGEVFTPEGASSNAPYWQELKAEKGDLHWTYVSNFIDQAGLRDVVKGEVYEGTYFSPEARLMGAIEAANGPEKFGGDGKGFPTFLPGVTYKLPVPSAEGFVLPPEPVTQAELMAQLKLMEERYAQLQPVTQEAYAVMSSQVQENADLLGTLSGRIDGLAKTQTELKQTTVDNTKSLGELTGQMGTFDERLTTTGNAATEAKQLAQGAVSDANSAVTSAKEAMSAVERSADKLAEMETQLPATVKTAVETEFQQQLPAITKAAETAATKAVGDAKGNDQLTWILLGLALLLSLGAIVFAVFTKRSTKKIEKKVEEHEGQINGPAGVIARQKALATKHNELETDVREQGAGIQETYAIATTALAQGSKLKEFTVTTDLDSVNVGKTSTWQMTDGHQQFEVHFTKREDGRFDWSVPRNSDGTGQSEPITFKSIETTKTKLQQAYAKERLQACAVKMVKVA